MWVFTKHGVLSIVQHKDLPNHFQVKSIHPIALERKETPCDWL